MASEDSIDRRNAIVAAAALAKKNAAIEAANKAKGLAKTGERDAADTVARVAVEQAAINKASTDKAAAEIAAKEIADKEAEAAKIAALKANPPGKAWLWDDATNNWVKPQKPTDGKSYLFNDDIGWEVTVVTDETDAPADDSNDPVVTTFTDSETGDIYNVHKSGKKTLLSKGTKKSDANAAAALALYNKQQAAIAKQAEEEAAKRDAFALIQDTMRSYGFTNAEMSELSGFIEKQIIDPNIGPNMAILNMRNLGVYKARFAGNETLLKAGKNALSEYDYLQQENAYDEYFKAYGVNNLSTRAQKATLIGNTVSALEVDKRLNLAVKRVQNSDPEILKQLKLYYPSITDKDLVSYFLNPETARLDLERKVNSAEIGAAASSFGLGIDEQRANMFSGLGITQATAQQGYKNIAQEFLPTSKKLSNVYKEEKINYDQKTAEQEEFNLVGGTEAANQRKLLQSKERASFSASAGNAPGAYSTGYLKKSSAAGLI